MLSKRKKFVNFVEKIILMILGALLASVGLEIFLIPNNIIDGGVVGISIISSFLTQIPIGVFTFIFNLPFLIVGYRQIGKTFALSTLFSVALLSTGVTLLHPVPGLTKDILLAAVFGGVLVGCGVGLIIRSGGSLDGTEIVAIILDKRTSFSIGEIVMFINFFILSSAGLVFGWDRAMYSLIAYFVAYKVIDMIVEGFDEAKAAIIVSEQYLDIIDAIKDRLGREVTVLKGDDFYNGTARSVIYAVITRLEIAKLKNIVHGFDENALLTFSNIELASKRYKKKSIH